MDQFQSFMDQLSSEKKTIGPIVLEAKDYEVAKSKTKDLCLKEENSKVDHSKEDRSKIFIQTITIENLNLNI